MRDAVFLARRDRPALVFLALLCIAVGTVQAQQSAAPDTRVEKSKSQAQENPNLRRVVLQIRSAFSLSPVMVKAIQAGIRDDLSRPNLDPLNIVPWNEPFTRSVPLAVPLDVQLTGSNVVVHIQILPTVLGEQSVELIIQGQMWAKASENSLSLNTTIQTINVGWGSRFFYYPLGMDPRTGAPIVMEIRVDKQKGQ